MPLAVAFVHSVRQLAKLEGDALRAAVAEACKQEGTAFLWTLDHLNEAWPKVLAMVDKDQDGRLRASDVGRLRPLKWSRVRLGLVFGSEVIGT